VFPTLDSVEAIDDARVFQCAVEAVAYAFGAHAISTVSHVYLAFFKLSPKRNNKWWRSTAPASLIG
jgi:hypothetical protein